MSTDIDFVGRITYEPTYRVKATNDRSVRDIAPVVNGNQRALQQLQFKVAELEERLTALEADRSE